MQSPSSQPPSPSRVHNPASGPSPTVAGPFRAGSRWRLYVFLDGQKFMPSYPSHRKALEASAVLLAASIRGELTPATIYPAGSRGFASMEPEMRRRIASAGGREAQRRGTAHRFRSAADAQAAGQVGAAVVLAVHGVEHFRSIGRQGGLARAEQRAQAKAAQRVLTEGRKK